MADRNDLITALNKLLEMEYVALIHSVQHAASVGGPHSQVFADRLRKQADSEIGHAIVLTQAILSRGGAPEWEIGRSHPFRSDQAGNVRALLEHDLDHQRQLIERYVEAAVTCQELDEVGLRIVLEAILGQRQTQLHELERILG